MYFFFHKEGFNKMTTSLAALAAASSSHSSSSTVLMSPASFQNSNNLSSISSSDITDSHMDIKTEFYTREGLWKLVPNGEYVRQQQQQQQQQSISQNSMGGGQVNNYTQSSFNEPVKLNVFKFSKNDEKRRNVCEKCILELQEKNKKETEDKNVQFNVYRSYDDNEDVVMFGQQQSNSTCVDDSDDDHDDDESLDDCEKNVNEPQSTYCKYCSASLCLDLVLFNYAREIYFYEFNTIKSKVRINLVIKTNIVTRSEVFRKKIF